MSAHRDLRPRRWVACNACGADDFRELRRVDDWHVGRCARCALIYVNPMPFFTPGEYQDLSHDYYYTRRQREISPVKVEVERRQLDRQLGEIRRLAAPPDGGMRFLDVGCGPGVAVRAAGELGWRAAGIDLDAELVRLGRTTLGVDLRCGTIADGRFETGHFTFVRLKSVLQVLPDPHDVLGEVGRVLAPGGVVLLVVPNEDGLGNRVELLLGRRRQGRRGTLILPYNLHGFTPATLTRLLARSGLGPLSVRTAMPTDVVYASPDEHDRATGSLGRWALTLAWRGANALGRGSLLVAYGAKPAASVHAA